MTTRTDCPRLVEGILVTALPGEEVVLSTADQQLAVVLNAVGAAVVDLCDGDHRVDDIASFLADCFPDAETDQIQKDVEAILHQLGEAGFLHD